MRKSTIWGGIAAGLALAALSGSAALGASGPLPVFLAPAPAGYQCNALVNDVTGRCQPGTGGQNVPAAAPLPVGVAGAWTLQFQDNFDTLDRSVWTPYWFKDCAAGSIMNGAQTCSSNVSVADGQVSLQLSGAGRGALISTNPKDGVAGHAGAAFGLGYYEARVLFPGSCGTRIYNWPAWWTTGQSWPGNGENDIAEPVSGVMHSNYHSAGGNFNQSISGCWAGAYHTYGLHRQAGRNDIYFDGALVRSYATHDGGALHHLVFNVGDSPGARAFGPAGTVKVDYVRVWK